MDRDVSLRTNTCRPRFCWQSDPQGFPRRRPPARPHTHTQRVWRSHTKPEGLILPPAHVIQTHLFKAIVVLFVWFLWSRALCEHCCLFFFCYCVRACVCVKVVSVCKKYKIKNGLRDCEQYTVPTYPEMYCAVNITTAKLQYPDPRNGKLMILLVFVCKSLRYFLFTES